MIGIRIKQLRKENGLTQSELGNKLGVIKQTISSWENGISNPSNETVAAMATIFNVSTDYLLGKSNLPTPEEITFPQTECKFNMSYWVQKAGYSTQEIATKLGISIELLTDYLENKVSPPYNILISLSEICEVSTDCLLGIVDKSREKTLDNVFPFRYDDKVAQRIKKLFDETDTDVSSSYLESLLSMSSKEIFYLIEYGFVPHIDTIIKLAHYFQVSTDYLLCQIDEQEEKVLSTFRKLNSDNKDIIVGEMKKYLKEQRYDESVAADDIAKKAVGK